MGPSPEPWADVRGWLTEEEGRALAALAAGKTVLEIGSYAGRSTICLAQTADRVYSLDWHLGDPGTWQAHGAGDTLAELRENLNRCGLSARVVLMVGTTAAVGPALGEAWCDLAFVDGAHDLASVTADLLLAARCLRPGGTVALHDWDYPAVREAAAGVLGPGHENTVGRLMWRQLP